MVTYPAARDLPRALVGWVTLLIVTREGGRRWKLRPSRRALVTLTHLRGHTALAKIATGSGISEAAAHVHVRGVPGHLAAKAFPFCLPCVARRPEYVLVDGAIARCNRAGDGRARTCAESHGPEVMKCARAWRLPSSSGPHAYACPHHRRSARKDTPDDSAANASKPY